MSREKGNNAEFFARLAARAEMLRGKLPSAQAAEHALMGLLGLLFPHFETSPALPAESLETRFRSWAESFARIVSATMTPSDAAHAVGRFHRCIPELYERLLLDADAHYEGDPAARSVDEVILCYPGFFAVATYRIAHVLQAEGVPLIPRIMTEVAHRRTGIDIHPGATIGERFCIDHGTGVVIGETTTIGAQVKLYQGVTLGALSVQKSLAGNKRHPTLEDRVIVYSNATILGGETVIGKDSIVGGQVWLTESVPPGSKVYHKADIVVS
ncbi:MAG: serine O-acetyltransferase [Bdellovibrionota bacterium]|nr:MAG: serine O-acetyltransferase [Bdellovibrionota bacterium]